MSDGKEVKRWLIFDIANRTFNFDEDQEMVLASDHDRIVAELRAELNQLKMMYDGLMVSARITRECDAQTIARQARVIEKLKETLKKCDLDIPLVSQRRMIERALEELAAIERAEGEKE